MEKVYGIFSGCYSDWSVHGFFTDIDKAERYCALQNKDGDGWDEYYVMELNEIDAQVSDVKLKYYYDMCVRFTENPNKYTIDEPSYDYYLGKDKSKSSQYNYFNNGSGWFSYSFNCDSDDKALKIIKDKYMEVLEKYSECGDFNMSAESVGSKHV